MIKWGFEGTRCPPPVDYTHAIYYVHDSAAIHGAVQTTRIRSHTFPLGRAEL